MREITRAKALKSFATRNYSFCGSKRALARELQISDRTVRRAIANGGAAPPRALHTPQWRSDVLKSIHHFQATKRLPPPHRSTHALRPVRRGVILPAHVHHRLTQLYKRRVDQPPVPDLRTLQRFFKQHVSSDDATIKKYPVPPKAKVNALLEKRQKERRLKKKS